MIFVQKPRHVSAEEAEEWLHAQLADFEGHGIQRVELKRLASPTLRFSETWSWMVQLDCSDPQSASAAVSDGAGLLLLADLRLLGMRPSIALVEDAD
jgi:hypothetical protein